MNEPLLQDGDETAGQTPAADAKDALVPVKSAQEESLDQEELQLFWYVSLSFLHLCLLILKALNYSKCT
jgi:hypothetical protein